MKSGVLRLYKKWLATATPEQVELVDSIYAECEEHYEDGGDLVVETMEPAQVLALGSIKAARQVCGLLVEQATNFREGNDNDPELGRMKRFRDNW